MDAELSRYQDYLAEVRFPDLTGSAGRARRTAWHRAADFCLDRAGLWRLRRRPMDLMIAGMRRSGTTLLANLLHAPPRQALLMEPAIPLWRQRQPKKAKRRLREAWSAERWAAESNPHR